MARYQTGYEDERLEQPATQTLQNEAILVVKIEEVEKSVKRVAEDVGKVVAKVELVQNRLTWQEKNNRQLAADNVEMKKSLAEITRQLQRIAQQTSNEVDEQSPNQVAPQKPRQAEERKKGISEDVEADKKSKIVIAGGKCYVSTRVFYCVDMFNLLSGKWRRLQLMMNVSRMRPSSVVYNNEMIIMGGFDDDGPTELIEKLSLDVVEDDHSITCENFPAKLPENFYVQGSVIHNNRLIVIGHSTQDDIERKSGFSLSLFKRTAPPSIFEISLFPPYTSKLLANMKETRHEHGVVLFGDKIVILGGRSDFNFFTALSSVLTYDIRRNEWTEFAPLPYAVSDMAAVKCGVDNIMIIGGVDQRDNPLNKVLLYNVQTQTHQMLPNMKYARAGCAAAVLGDAVIVMGGYDGRNTLKSVESFRFASDTWEDLPDMLEARASATAVAF